MAQWSCKERRTSLCVFFFFLREFEFLSFTETKMKRNKGSSWWEVGGSAREGVVVLLEILDIALCLSSSVSPLEYYVLNSSL